MDESKRLPGGRRKARSQHATGLNGIFCTNCGCRDLPALNSNPLPGQKKTRQRKCRNCGEVILVLEERRAIVRPGDPSKKDDSLGG